MLNTTVKKKRAVGVVLFVLILALFFSFNRFPKLDIVGDDLAAVTAPRTELVCSKLNGICLEREIGKSFVSGWFDFSVAYLRLVTVGMTFAFLVAGLAESFLFPPGTKSNMSSGGVFGRTLKGAALGPVMNLCSACIVPVSASFQRKGGGIEGSIAMVQGSATMNIPALVIVFFVFTPILGFSRLLLAVVGALILGPIVYMTMRRRSDSNTPDSSTVEPEPIIIPSIPDTAPWREVLPEAFRDWAKASLGYLVRMGPIMVVAGFISGLVIHWLSPSTIATYLGNDLQGVAIAATFGILINVPLLFEIPLVALLLLLGMGTAPAATLLFTAAAGGPVTFWGMAKLMPKRSLATFAASTWVLGAVGGLVVLGISAYVWEGAGSDLRIKQSEARSSYSNITPVVEPSPQPIFTDSAGQTGIEFQEASIKGDPVGVGTEVLVFDYNDDGFDDQQSADGTLRNGSRVRTISDNFRETSTK